MQAVQSTIAAVQSSIAVLEQQLQNRDSLEAAERIALQQQLAGLQQQLAALRQKEVLLLQPQAGAEQHPHVHAVVSSCPSLDELTGAQTVACCTSNQLHSSQPRPLRVTCACVRMLQPVPHSIALLHVSSSATHLCTFGNMIWLCPSTSYRPVPQSLMRLPGRCFPITSHVGPHCV